MSSQLFQTIQELEKKFLPIKDILEQSDKFNQLYKGIISIQSNVIYNPDVLFIGINPGQGAFIEKNNNSNKITYPERLTINKTNASDIGLDWLKKGNARGESKNRKWFPYEWTDRDKKINNIFPARMIDLLYCLAEEKNEDKVDNQSNEFINKIMTDVVAKIMYTNINPIATKSTAELDKIISLLSKENELKNHWNSKKGIKITKSVVNNFFRQRTFDLIDILNPKTIVCMGNRVQNELTYKRSSEENKVNVSEYSIRDKKYPLITFSRKGNWSTLVKEVSTAVQKEIIKRNSDTIYSK